MKRIAGYALMLAPFVLVVALDASRYGIWLALAKLAIAVTLAGALVLGFKLATEPGNFPP